ncbi:hypothetical protein FRC04_005969 [Tulasnella sp. 424]|nr:hypothetical protein FRC04_005969 [Tulasnella sp. 424]KAG8974654.1 hypothetical protein FRC05_006988 [Tulasnella sp. 425]
MRSEILVAIVATLLIVVVVGLSFLIIAGQLEIPLRPGPPPQIAHKFDFAFLTQYWLYVRSTLDWLGDRGLPITRFTRAILDRVVLADGNDQAIDDHLVEARRQDPSLFAQVALQPPPPVPVHT